MSYHYLFYGLDTYRSAQKINSLISKYIDSSMGNTNLARIDAEQSDINEIIRQIYAAPFFSKKRLVVLKNFLLTAKKEQQEKILSNLEKIPKTTLLIFWENGLPDARSSLFKALNIAQKSQKFDLLSPVQLQLWIDKYCNSRGGSILPGARQLLVEWIDADLWRMSNECNKLISAAEGEPITQKLVEEMVSSFSQAKSFALIDALFGKFNSKTALSAYSIIEENGEYPLIVLSLISNTLARVIMIKAWQEEGLTQNQIAQKIKIHPYALKKITDIYCKISFEKCFARQELIFKIDFQIKSGKIDIIDAIWYLIAQWE